MAKKAAKPIFIPGTNQTFASASAAAKALGINSGNIYSVLAGRRKTAGGYTFGYMSNRKVYIPELGQAFDTIKSAARAVRVSPKKALKGLEGRSGSAIGGFHFTYADASKMETAAPSAPSAPSAPTTRKKRNAKKAERIKEHRVKQQQRKQRQKQKEDIRAKEREESAKQHKLKEQRKRLGDSYKNYETAKEELRKYILKINQQIDEYIKLNPALVYYHPAAPAVFGMTRYVGGNLGPYDIPYFDEDMSKFALPEDANKETTDKLTDRMNLLQKRLKIESEQKGRNFFDMNLAEQNRRMLALEFFKTTGHEDEMDAYAYMIWDIIDVIQRSNRFEEMGSDLIFQMVSDAMQGNIDPKILEQFIDDLDAWMSGNGSQDELDDILAELDGTYTKKKGYSVFDDDEGWF